MLQKGLLFRCGATKAPRRTLQARKESPEI
jgi:hypothetical protein